MWVCVVTPSAIAAATTAAAVAAAAVDARTPYVPLNAACRLISLISREPVRVVAQKRVLVAARSWSHWVKPTNHKGADVGVNGLSVVTG